MSTSTTAVTSSKAPGFARRKSRTLVGWLSEQEGALWLSGRQITQAPDPTHLAICQVARSAVSNRLVGCDQTNIFQPLPNTLDSHIAALRAHPKTAQVLAEAGDPRIVDLRKVCAAQPTIHVEDAAVRVSRIEPNDIVSIAEVTLPLHCLTEMPVTFDPNKNAWLLSSPNPNLRVTGHFGGEVQPGVNGYGFVVDILLSYLQVAGVNGRFFLRDGYHRAFGLLAAGINFAPALVREYATIEEVMMPPGLLSPSTYLGTRPPLLGDYLDPTVSVESSVPVMTKMVVVQAIELSSLS